MPNSETFSIQPIGEFVQRYLADSTVSVDPFARDKRWATYTNDLNPNTAAEYHMECEDFLQKLADDGVVADLIIMDPPYSPRQVKECYDGIGRKMAMEDAWGGAVRKRRRALVYNLVEPGAVVLSFGWNTNGMGKTAMNDELLIEAFPGGYGRIGQIWVGPGECDVCGDQGVMIHGNGSEGEYAGPSICQKCVETAFQRYEEGERKDTVN
jgi:hypothetical protein